jgi:hypothetical protein
MIQTASTTVVTEERQASQPAKPKQTSPERGASSKRAPAPASRSRRSPTSQAGSSPHPEVPPRPSATPYQHAPAAASPPASEPPTEARPEISPERGFNELVRRASDGNDACLAGLKRILDDRPEIWRKVGNVAAMTEKAWVDLLAGTNALVQQAIPRRLKAVKAELAGSQPTAIEKLLVDLIGTHFLAANHAQCEAASRGGSIQQATLQLKRAESANRRFLSAVKMLATVRSLMP